MTPDPERGRTHFLTELTVLRQQIMDQGTVVRARVDRALRGFAEGNVEMLDDVTVGDADVNERQMAIDDRAFKLLALHQPVATDLRVIVAAIKINGELERVGDLAVNLAESARRYLATGRLPEQSLLLRMADVATIMFQDALASFGSGHLGTAQAVLERDDALDTLRGQTFRTLVQAMTDSVTRVPSALELMLMARHLERIGDHATNIAEDVFFVVAGEDVRHHALNFPPARPPSSDR